MAAPDARTGTPRFPGGGSVAVVCAGCGLDGSVARVALWQARQLASAFRAYVLSESLPPALPPRVTPVRLAPRRFDSLRRLCHVPNALAFAHAVGSTLSSLHRASPLSLVICHDVVVAALVARRLKRRQSVPFALCAHEDIAFRPRGTYGLLHTWLHQWATPLAYGEADGVLAISPHMVSRARAHGADPDRITLCPAGLEPAELGLASGETEGAVAGEGSETLRILYVGRLAVEKGVGVLLEACRQLDARETAYTLELIGEGPLRPRLERQARDLGLTDRVRFLGALPRERLGFHYRGAHVVCMPSLDEPFGAVALEALLCGTPVVASDVGGIPFVVRDGGNGLLVPPGEPGPLAGALALLDQDRDRLAALRRAAHASVRSRFAWTRAAEGVLEGVRRTIRTARAAAGLSGRRPGLADGA